MIHGQRLPNYWPIYWYRFTGNLLINWLTGFLLAICYIIFTEYITDGLVMIRSYSTGRPFAAAQIVEGEELISDLDMKLLRNIKKIFG